MPAKEALIGALCSILGVVVLAALIVAFVRRLKRTNNQHHPVFKPIDAELKPKSVKRGQRSGNRGSIAGTKTTTAGFEPEKPGQEPLDEPRSALSASSSDLSTTKIIIEDVDEREVEGENVIVLNYEREERSWRESARLSPRFMTIDKIDTPPPFSNTSTSVCEENDSDPEGLLVDPSASLREPPEFKKIENGDLQLGSKGQNGKKPLVVDELGKIDGKPERCEKHGKRRKRSDERRRRRSKRSSKEPSELAREKQAKEVIQPCAKEPKTDSIQEVVRSPKIASSFGRVRKLDETPHRSAERSIANNKKSKTPSRSPKRKNHVNKFTFSPGPVKRQRSTPSILRKKSAQSLSGKADPQKSKSVDKIKLSNGSQKGSKTSLKSEKSSTSSLSSLFSSKSRSKSGENRSRSSKDKSQRSSSSRSSSRKSSGSHGKKRKREKKS